MRYEYKCEKCNKKVEVNKPMIHASREERCTKCNSVMVRTYNIKIKTGDGTK